MGSLLDQINELFRSETDIVITEKMLLEFPLDRWENIDKGIEGKLVYVDENVIVFLTKIKKGVTFGRHLHDLPEWCFVITGFLGDKITKQKKVKGQVISYFENVPHKPYGIDNTLICVVFDRNK